MDILGSPILLDVFDLLASWNWNEVVALSKYPGDAHLRRRSFVRSGNFLEQVDDLKDTGEVLGTVSRYVAAEVSRVEVVIGFLYSMPSLDRDLVAWNGGSKILNVSARS